MCVVRVGVWDATLCLAFIACKLVNRHRQDALYKSVSLCLASESFFCLHLQQQSVYFFHRKGGLPARLYWQQ